VASGQQGYVGNVHMTLTVPAEKVAKNFGQFQDAALSEPVIVTKYGRESVVIIKAAEYHRLKKWDREVLRPHELSDADIAALQAATPPPDAARFDHEVKK
jgi:prevent-host-death family protein